MVIGYEERGKRYHPHLGLDRDLFVVVDRGSFGANHILPFLFPSSKFADIAAFVFVNIWTVLIHDGEFVAFDESIKSATRISSLYSFSSVFKGLILGGIVFLYAV